MQLPARIISIILTALLVTPLFADVRVPGIFSNNAVLQIGPKTPIWGWANPGEAVTVTLGGISAATVATPDGSWRVELPLNTANATPQNLVIQGVNTLTITNVLVGEVWLCSGQSNMERQLYATTGGRNEIALSNNPSIRHFDTTTFYSSTPLTNQTGSWSVASPDTSGNFTAVGYYFAKKLNAELGVPVAIINSSKGGTAIQEWISIEAFGWNSDLKAYRDIPSTDCSRLFNGMIAPWAGYGIRGVNWYQGETNANAGDSSAFYRSALMVIIQDWRRWWRQGDLFFNICQLSTYTVKITDANDGQLWPAIRESQFQASKIIPNAEIANLIDLGEADIHPKNKKDVGDRLVLNALARVYSRTLVHRGPVYKSMSIEGSKIRIAFDHTDLGLVAKPVPDWYWLSSSARTTAPIVRNSPASQLEGFAIRSASGVWVWANATIDGNTVLVESTAVPSPAAVRYAWNNNPTCNLYNGAGLPTVSFRTDQPPLIALPVAVAQSLITLPDRSLPITLNGTELGSSPLTFSIFSPPSRGTLSGTPPNIIYNPAPGARGPDEFSFVVNNGTINSVPASVMITVTPSTVLAPNVSLAGTWFQGATRDKVAGSNRALVVMVYAEGSTTIAPSSVTYGGQTMTKVVEMPYQESGTGSYSYTGAFILHEAGITAAATTGTIAVSWSSAPSTGSDFTSAFFTNVNQTTITGSTARNGLSGATITTSPLATAVGDMVVVGGTTANPGTYTINNGFTRGIAETSASFGDITSCYKVATGTSEIPSVTMSSSMRQTIVGFVLNKMQLPMGLTFSGWTTSNGLSGTSANADADPDGDGMKNMVEYALGLNPTTSEVSPIKLDTVNIGGKTYLRLSVNRNPAATDVVIEGLSSGILDNETTSWSASTTVVETDTSTHYVVRDTVAIGDTNKRFIRLKFGPIPSS